jgi:hypothetical protein
MSKLKILLVGGAFIGLGLLAIGLIATVLVLLAYGLGSLLARLLPLDIGQTTLLALVAIITAIIIMWRLASPPLLPYSWNNKETDEWLEEEEDEGDEVVGVVSEQRPPSPRQPQPEKPGKYEAVGRNDPCPCGSGRKYKNCHG